MSAHFHAVVWIDHYEARIFHFSASEVDRLVIHPDRPARHLHHKAQSIGSGNAPEDHDFLQRVADAMSDAGVILVTGPANEKTELVKHIRQHAPVPCRRSWRSRPWTTQAMGSSSTTRDGISRWIT